MPNPSVAERVLGITDPSDLQGSMCQAYEVLTGVALDGVGLLELIQENNSLAHRPKSEISVDETQRSVDLSQLWQLIETKSFSSTSPLSSWEPTRIFFENHGTKLPGNSRALLIGAYSAISARAFDVFARETFGASKPTIIDIEASEAVQRHGQFIFGSGLALPFQTESIDLVQTNQLLNMLKDPSNPDRSPKQMAVSLLLEISRVLKPGGQLIMQELPADVADDTNVREAAVRIIECKNFILDRLHSHGFQTVVGEAPTFSQNDAVLFSTEPSSVNTFDYTRISSALIYGRKLPPLGPIALGTAIAL